MKAKTEERRLEKEEKVKKKREVMWRNMLDFFDESSVIYCFFNGQMPDAKNGNNRIYRRIRCHFKLDFS